MKKLELEQEIERLKLVNTIDHGKHVQLKIDLINLEAERNELVLKKLGVVNYEAIVETIISHNFGMTRKMTITFNY